MKSPFSPNYFLPILLALTLAGSSLRSAEPWVEIYPVRDGHTLLQIGNSLTGSGEGAAGYANAMLQQHHGISMKLGRLSFWGKSLEEHYHLEHDQSFWDPVPETYSKMYEYSNNSFEGLIDPTQGAFANIQAGPQGVEGRWDTVFLQDWKSDGTDDPEAFFNYTRKFDQVIRKQGGQTFLYMRLPAGPKGVDDLEGLNRRAQLLDENYTRIGRELGADVAPVAVAYNLAVQRLVGENPPSVVDNIKALYPDAESPDDAMVRVLWGGPESDLTHQGAYGKALYGFVIYSILAQESPVGKELRYADLGGDRGNAISVDEELEAYLQQTAWEVVAPRVEWDEPGYQPPDRTGSVTTEYDPATGNVSVTISGQVIGLRLGSPAAQLMTGESVELGGVAPVQGDQEILAFYQEAGLPEGTFELPAIVKTGTDYAEALYFGYTPAEGPAGEAVPGAAE